MAVRCRPERFRAQSSRSALAPAVTTIADHIRLLCAQVHRQVEPLCDGFAVGTGRCARKHVSGGPGPSSARISTLGLLCQRDPWNPPLPPPSPPPCPTPPDLS